jgi:hypothetical protein
MAAPDLDQIVQLLTSGDPMEEQKRLAARLRGQEQMTDMMQRASTQGQGLDLLNFASQNANNPALAGSVGLLTKARQAQYTPQRLDKGVYVPATGEYQESPGVADEKEADRDNRRLTAIGLLTSRAYQADQALEGKRLMASVLGQSRAAADEARAARLELQRERLANTVSQANQRDVTQFGGTLTKNGVPQIAQAVYDIHDLLAKPEGSIAGVGYGQKTLSQVPWLSDLTIGEEGKANRATIQRLRNALTLTEAGKAVTKQEDVRQALVAMDGDNYTEKDFRNAMNKVILPALENVRSNVLKQTDPSIVDQYMRNDDSGFNPRKSFLPGKGTFVGGTVTPPSVPAMVPDVPRKGPTVIHFDAQGNPVK